MPQFNFDYDRKTDYLEVESADYDELEYRESVNWGEVTVNIAHSDEVMSVEVMNASQLFELTPDELDRLDTVSIGIDNRGSQVAVHIKVQYKKKESNFGFQIDNTQATVTGVA